jgi:hypothetical protein
MDRDRSSNSGSFLALMSFPPGSMASLQSEASEPKMQGVGNNYLFLLRTKNNLLSAATEGML